MENIVGQRLIRAHKTMIRVATVTRVEKHDDHNYYSWYGKETPEKDDEWIGFSNKEGQLPHAWDVLSIENVNKAIELAKLALDQWAAELLPVEAA